MPRTFGAHVFFYFRSPSSETQYFNEFARGFQLIFELQVFQILCEIC